MTAENKRSFFALQRVFNYLIGHGYATKSSVNPDALRVIVELQRTCL